MDKRLIEELASLAHEQWAGWMHHMFERTVPNPNGDRTIKCEDVNRWIRQMNTEYMDLSDVEKISDRAQALKMIDVVVRHIRG